MVQMSIFDDDDKRMTEIDDRCKDYRRLGSFFKPWYWDIKRINTESPEKTLMEYFDFDKLKELYENINWIKYNNFISGDNEIENRRLFAHYLSHIVLNEYIVNDINYEDIKEVVVIKNWQNNVIINCKPIGVNIYKVSDEICNKIKEITGK